MYVIKYFHLLFEAHRLKTIFWIKVILKVTETFISQNYSNYTTPTCPVRTNILRVLLFRNFCRETSVYSEQAANGHLIIVKHTYPSHLTTSRSLINKLQNGANSQTIKKTSYPFEIIVTSKTCSKANIHRNVQLVFIILSQYKHSSASALIN